MKITKIDLTIMREAIAPHDTESNRSIHIFANSSDRRYQWDLLRQAGLMPFVCDVLYKYANDTHIDTALRSIVKPLKSGV